MKTLLIGITLSVSVLATPALAQGFGGGRDQTRQEAQQRADMMFQMMDANQDGTVSKVEADQALAQFASRGGGNGGGGRMQAIVDQLFATSPSLTKQQFEAQALTRFDAMDLNHDGVVTQSERQQARTARQAGAAPGVSAAATPTKSN